MTKDEALAKEKALQALHDENERLGLYKDAYAEQEPVAYGMWDTMIGCGGRMMYVRLDKGQDGCTVPLYTHPLVPTAQPEQEPVGEIVDAIEGAFKCSFTKMLPVGAKLYTTPPQRKPLSNEEIYKIYRDCGDLNVKINIARAIEATHGIKENT